jgi:hypothetical protein
MFSRLVGPADEPISERTTTMDATTALQIRRRSDQGVGPRRWAAE